MNLVACDSCYEGQLRFPPIYSLSKMDYRQKAMTVPPTMIQSKTKEDDDDDDLEALREAALRSLNQAGQNKTKFQPPRPIITRHGLHPHRNQYKSRPNYLHRPLNGIKGYHCRVPRNPNLIEIIPVDETTDKQNISFNEKEDNFVPNKETQLESTKFQRYEDDVSGSEDDDAKEHKCASDLEEGYNDADGSADKENKSDAEASSTHSKDSDEKSMDKVPDDDDDDVLLMADFEEEDSLERLMDEMEREISDGKPVESKKSAGRLNSKGKPRAERQEVRKRSKSPLPRKKSPLTSFRSEQRMSSPYEPSRNCRKRKTSLSPKVRSRKTSPKRSPRRSPRRSPIRQKLRLEQRYKSPMRYSPRPLLSPPRSTSRCLVARRSVSPRSPPRSRRGRSRSPRELRRSRSPQRKMSPRRSPRPLSPSRRSPGKFRSPRHSPWNSPKHSPRRDWSPKESSKRPRSASSGRERELSPATLNDAPSPNYRSKSPQVTRSKVKAKDEVSDKFTPASEVTKASSAGSTDEILEARRRKFESAVLINPVIANKKIKLSKKDKIEKTDEEDCKGLLLPQDATLCLDASYDFPASDSMLIDQSSEELEEPEETEVCVAVEESRPEKEKKKKKKKKDKELYQIGKLKDMPLSERIVKEKKTKRRKDTSSPVDDVGDAVVENVPIDEEGDLRAELSRRRAERLKHPVAIQSARLVQSAFKGVVKEVAKNNAKVGRRTLLKGDEKVNKKQVRRVTVVRRSISDLHNSEDEGAVDSKVPVHFRLGVSKSEPKVRKAKRQNRKVKHKNNLIVDSQHLL